MKLTLFFFLRVEVTNFFLVRGICFVLLLLFLFGTKLQGTFLDVIVGYTCMRVCVGKFVDHWLEVAVMARSLKSNNKKGTKRSFFSLTPRMPHPREKE